MPSFHLTSFGCRASQADGAAVKKQLLDAGFTEAASYDQAGVAVVNTCTVTATADAEIRRLIRRIHQSNPHCRIVVSGCYAQRSPKEIAALPGVACIVGNSDKHRVAALLEPISGGIEHASVNALISVNPIAPEFHFAPVYADDRTRPTLKVQDGCNARCSFCVIPSVRGSSRSLDPERVVKQTRELVLGGTKEIVLSGINLGSYGKDLSPRISFVALLERMLAETTIRRLRISSIEPMDVTPQLIELMARETRIAPHFHVPLQSGSDRILRLMNRRYWVRQYAERIFAARERVPAAAIGADVMVGFPGETEADFDATAALIESLPFTYLHVFPFSSRPGTPAAEMPGQLNGRIVHERARRLLALGARKRESFMHSQIGRVISVLTLDELRDGRRVGMSENYLRVLLAPSAAANQLLDVAITRAEGEFLCGSEESPR